MSALRVLRLMTRGNLGGPASQAYAMRGEFQRLGVHELCVVGSLGEGELAHPSFMDCVPLEEAIRGLRQGQRPPVVRLRGLGRGRMGWGGRGALRELLELQRVFRADLVHTHMAQAGMLGVRFAKQAGIPVVHSYHGHVLRDYYNRPLSMLYRAIERRLCRQRDLVLAISESCRDELRELGVLRKDQGEVHAPAILLPQRLDDAERARIRQGLRAELGIEEDALAIVFIGRLVQIKDPLLFARTALEAAKSRRRVRAFVYGDGPLREALAPFEGDTLRVMGADPHVREKLPAFDAFVSTSVREGHPVAALEALIAGVPVIASRVPGNVDLESTNCQDSAVRLCPRDPSALASALEELPKLSEARIEELRGRCSASRIAGVLLQHYQGCLEQSRSRATSD